VNGPVAGPTLGGGPNLKILLEKYPREEQDKIQALNIPESLGDEEGTGAVHHTELYNLVNQMQQQLAGVVLT